MIHMYAAAGLHREEIAEILGVGLQGLITAITVHNLLRPRGMPNAGGNEMLIIREFQAKARYVRQCREGYQKYVKLMREHHPDEEVKGFKCKLPLTAYDLPDDFNVDP
jgi:hypothetical protein